MRAKLLINFIAFLAMIAIPASAQGAVSLGFSDNYALNLDSVEYNNVSNNTIDDRIDKSKAAGASYIRVNVQWKNLYQNQGVAPQSPRNHTDSAYKWVYLDKIVNRIRAKGLEPFLKIYYAPNFAEHFNSSVPSTDPKYGYNWCGQGAQTRGGCNPDSNKYGDFARAITNHYDGYDGRPLVHHYETWIEPNTNNYLESFSGNYWLSHLYVGMNNAFYDNAKLTAINSVVPNPLVTAGATAPSNNGSGQQPLAFWRNILCLNSNNQPGSCVAYWSKLKSDFVSTHIIDNPQAPVRNGGGDTLYSGAFLAWAGMIDTAEANGRIGGAANHHLWLTEMWWSTDHPNVSASDQGSYMTSIMNILSYYKASGVPIVGGIFLEVQDWGGGLKTGIYYGGGNPKHSPTWKYP